MSAPAPHPLAPDAAVALARETPPHRRLEMFLDRLAAIRRGSVPTTRAEAFLAWLGPDATVATLARAETSTSRTFHSVPAAELDGLLTALRRRWPTPGAGERRLVERVEALHEVAVLRDAGELSAAAAVRLAYVLDPARPTEPPPGLDAALGHASGPLGLREARARLVAAAPTFWRLAGAELDRLVDRLDPAAP